MKYGDILKSKIKERGLSYRGTGKLLGYSAVHILDICKSRKAPSLKLAIKIKNEFGFDVTDADNIESRISFYVRQNELPRNPR